GRGDKGSGATGEYSRLYRSASRRLRHSRHGRRRKPFKGAEATYDDSARDAVARAYADTGRSYVQRGYAYRTSYTRRDGQTYAGQDLFRHRSQAFHDKERGSYPRRKGRRYR